MGLRRLQSFLRRHNRIALDTNILIYQLEANPKYEALTDVIFGWLDQPASSAVTSTITMTELLVQPLCKDDQRSAELYYSLLSTHPNLHWVAPDLDVASLAARYRAQFRLKTIDALLAATAARASATGLITNDAAIARVDDLDVLVLDDLLPA